jgi:hypothetical protein
MGFARHRTSVHDYEAAILKGCEEIAWRLQKDFQLYELAIELYHIINNSGKKPHICRRLSECYIQTHQYVEAARVLSDASNLESNSQASLSGR